VELVREDANLLPVSFVRRSREEEEPNPNARLELPSLQQRRLERLDGVRRLGHLAALMRSGPDRSGSRPVGDIRPSH
jgi:hypothetical protein